MKKPTSNMHAFPPTFLAVVTLFGILLYLAAVPNNQSTQAPLEQDVCRHTAYSHQSIPRDNTPLGVVDQYTWTIGPEDPVLAIFLVHQYGAVYIDGVLREEVTKAPENHFSDTIGSIWLFTRFEATDVGKTITVEITPVYQSFLDKDPLFYLGTKADIILHQMHRDAPDRMLSLVSILSGLAFIGYDLYRLFLRKSSGYLLSLGLLSALLGLWGVADNRTTVLLHPELSTFLFYLADFVLMLGPLPLIAALQIRTKGKYDRPLFSIWLLTLVSCLVQLLLHFSGLLELREMLHLSHVVVILCAAVIVLCAAHDRKHSPEAGPKGLPVLPIAGVLLDLAVFHFTGESPWISFSLLAFLLYIFLLGINTILEYRREVEVHLRKQDALINENRIAVMLSQIQPHFLYNSLTAIAQLCGKDATLAKEATITFADYLRGNMNSLQEAKLIPFLQELDHIKMYIFLEKLRFEEQLQINYHIESSHFLVPPLTVQPLVENAVKHGIGEKEDGGTISITTVEDQACYRVIIQDDGIGFDSIAQQKDPRQHIGIANARSRLQILCGGSLTIESTPGIGTISTITIPKGGVLP